MKIILTGDVDGLVKLVVEDVPDDVRLRALLHQNFLMALIARLPTAVLKRECRLAIRNLATLGLWEACGKPPDDAHARNVQKFEDFQRVGMHPVEDYL